MSEALHPLICDRLLWARPQLWTLRRKSKSAVWILLRRIFSRRSEARSEEARCSVNVHPAQQRRKPPSSPSGARKINSRLPSAYHEEHPDQTAVECESKTAHVLLIKSATWLLVSGVGIEPTTL